VTNLFFILLQDSIEIRIECLFTELDKLQENLIKQIDLFEKKLWNQMILMGQSLF
jgi:hypothetical protein